MRKLVIFSFWLGQMTERPKVHDWKSCVPPKGTVGSNPTLSAIFKALSIVSFFYGWGGCCFKSVLSCFADWKSCVPQKGDLRVWIPLKSAIFEPLFVGLFFMVVVGYLSLWGRLVMENFLDKIKIKNKGKKKMLTPTNAFKHIVKSMLP